jgi:transposase
MEICFADAMRVGQKNPITRRWAKRGTRPSAPKDQRTASAYLFGAICPKLGTGAALVLPRGNTAAMTLHLQEIVAAVAPGAHAVLLLDHAGWHVSAKLRVPPNITLMPLPPKAPELNPVATLWQFLRDNWLSNRICQSYDDILDHACAAWQRIVDQPWHIMTIGMRDWAHRFRSMGVGMSRELGIHPKTVAKWRKRATVEDLKTGPKEPRSTVLTEQEEAAVVAFRGPVRTVVLGVVMGVSTALSHGH